MELRAWRVIVSAALGAAVFILGSGANAGVVVKAHYDPPPPEFVGDAVFDVDPSCMSVSDGLYVLPSGTCAITMTGNVVSDPSPPAPIDFASVLPNSADILSIVVIGGKLVGVNTNPIGYVTVEDIDYWFDFQSFFSPGFCGDSECFGPSVTNFVNLYDDCYDGCGDPIYTADKVSFTPEPGSIALILGALGAGWLTRRRKIAI